MSGEGTARERGTGGDLGLTSNSVSLWIHGQNNISEGPLHLIHSSRGPDFVMNNFRS